PKRGGARPQTHRNPRRASRPPAPQTAAAASPPAAHAPSRSTLAGSYGAPPPTKCPADRSQHRAPRPQPPAHAPADPPEPQRSPDRTGRVDSPAAAAAARSAPPSGSEDRRSHRPG